MLRPPTVAEPPSDDNGPGGGIIGSSLA